MKTLKLYLDTSVISHLQAPDTPDKQADTLQLWQDIKAGKYDVVISTTVNEELSNCNEPKRSYMRQRLTEIDTTLVYASQDIVDIANQIIAAGILTQKSYADCLHIACAIISECDYLVSWNFKHLVNIKTINGVRAITVQNHSKQVDIISPTMLIGDSQDDL